MLQDLSDDERPDRESFLMGLAEVYSLRSSCTRARVGAVLVREGRPIAAGYNGSPAGTPSCYDEGCQIGPSGSCERTIHAEANAISTAARLGISTAGAELYCTFSPCMVCARLVIGSGIRRVIYRDVYSKGHDAIDFLSSRISVGKYIAP